MSRTTEATWTTAEAEGEDQAGEEEVDEQVDEGEEEDPAWDGAPWEPLGGPEPDTIP